MGRVPDTPTTRYTSFAGDAHLLSELGERLITDPQIALSELIKNSYDADATEVYVWYTSGARRALHLLDNGRGMSVDEFLSNWMRVGTTDKLRDSKSTKLRRPVTGSKGVGRFAARRLGRFLSLETASTQVAGAPGTSLRASFDWDQFKGGKQLDLIKIPYQIGPPVALQGHGTHLEIAKLTDPWDASKLLEITGHVLGIIRPPLPEWLRKRFPASAADPGLTIYFGEPGSGRKLEVATSEIVERWVARATFEVSDSKVTFQLIYRSIGTWEPRSQQVWQVAVPGRTNLVGPIVGEVRFFPKRPGVLAGLKSAGRTKAAQFLKANGGVAVVDRGIRMLPYGTRDDDWLYLSGRYARNVRGWSSPITEQLFPRNSLEREGRYSPFLRIPASHQLMGWVAIESSRSSGSSLHGKGEVLEPAMNRQGLVQNSAFDQLRFIAAAAVEIIAVVDAEQVRQIDEEEAQKKVRAVQAGIEAAIRRVRTSRTIPEGEKDSIESALRSVAKRAEISDEARKKSIEAAEAASLLGVLAGFMSHESKVLMESLHEAVRALGKAEREGRDQAIREARIAVERSVVRLESFITYSQGFFQRVPEPVVAPFSPARAVDNVISLFKDICQERGVTIQVEVPENLVGPKVWEGLYSGIVLNLLTNALKAIFRAQNLALKVVRITASNIRDTHILRVSDSGAGIVDELADYIFDPFISTTSNQPGPLEGGSGLGLYIVRRGLSAADGSVQFAPPPEGFTTCFEVRIPV